ncbi:S8 family serine peptidase [Oscillatoria sp. CS-180]|uniref:S8 family serine peptidase n=1 Tax=Oscillatoria sp. CS-180 TaxID=3021720 RepID=UPI00232BFC28|nr:S8 family serine peptidase [Oscillatoria sp. CS-180]MDB9525002.1 S8 family serine peptidase [Oscillatoria sp. CS-180]
MSTFQSSLEQSSDPLGLESLSSLEQALAIGQDWVDQFLSDANWLESLTLPFGQTFDLAAVGALFQDVLSGNWSALPSIEMRSSDDINGANGAFAATTNTIYLAEDFVDRYADTPELIAEVWVEELGHFVDARINTVDSAGDEGAIFAALIQGLTLDQGDLDALLHEDDSVVLNLDGQVVELEQATPGVNPAFDLIGLTQLRNDNDFAGIDGSGFSVAVIDSRVDFSHPELQPNFRAFVNFTDAEQPDFHGTHVAGSVGARDENLGVAPDVGLIGLNVFPSNANLGARNDDIYDALSWVLDNHEEYNIVAVNMSLGSGFYSSESQVIGDPTREIINRLEGEGITVVSAGGNSYKETEVQNFGAPAIYSTLAVGAVWQDASERNIQWGSGAIDFTTGADRVTSFTQRLVAENTIFAPGALITSTVPGGDIGLSGGTSMASPIVAGAVALMQEAAQLFGGRLLTPAEIVEIMRSTADDIFDGDDEDNNVNNSNESYLRLNIYSAVSEIERRFQDIAPTGDPNGTLRGAIIGPRLDGSPVNSVLEAIGTDGGSTSVGDTDVDMIRFEVDSPGRVTLELGTHPNTPDDFDTYLRLFDEDGQELAANDDIQPGVEQFSRITADLATGTYFVGVSGYLNDDYDPTVAGSGEPGDTGSYALQLSLENDDPNGLISGAVPIVFSDSREPVVNGGTIGFDYGELVGVADVDLFEVRVPDDGMLLIDIDTPFETDFVDSYLRIFDESGNELVASDDDLAVDISGEPDEFTDFRFPGLVFEDPDDRDFFFGHTTDSFVSGTVQGGDVYYIGVSDFDNQNYDPNTLNNRRETGDGGAYDLHVTFANNDQNGSITQALDDSIIPLPVTQQAGTIGTDTDFDSGQVFDVGDRDVDFVKINSPTAGILEIDIDSYSEPSISDTVDAVALIFDDQGNLLSLNDDNEGSFDPLLQYEIAANTDYYVAVTGYGNEDFDPFQLASGTPGDTGDYLFSSRVLPLNQVGTLSNDTIGGGSIQAVGIGSIVPGFIGQDNGFFRGPADIDIFRFTPTQSGIVNIQTLTFDAFSADTFLRVFNANGVEIAANDDADFLTTGSAVNVSVTAGSTYYIGVNGYSPQAQNYDPFTGIGAAPGVQGGYTLVLNQSSTAPIPTFEADDYLASNPDLIQAFGYNLQAATDHYQRSGQFEGRAIDLFPEDQYFASYSDLAATFGNNPVALTRHYIEHGFREGRDPLLSFDGGAYIASYGDLINAFGYSPAAGKEHYRRQGYPEGRSITFQADEYIASYGDLIQTLGYNLDAGTQHYITQGISENRSPDLFDAASYLNRYADLQIAFGTNLDAATQHYIQTGFFEGRIA